MSRPLDSAKIRTSTGEHPISCVVCNRVIDKGERYYDARYRRTHIACFSEEPKANQLVAAEPSRDGWCVRCNQDKAVTRDKRFCRRCLRLVVAEQNP